MSLKIWNKKVVYCFLSGLLTSLWLYTDAYNSQDYPMIIQIILVGIIPGVLFPAALLVTEGRIEPRKAVIFLSVCEAAYILSAIAMWVTTIHDYFTPMALACINVFLPLSIFILYFNLIKRVHRYKNVRNWIGVLSLGSMLLFICIGYIKVHFFHPYMIHPDRMEEYFHFGIWCCPVWQTAFAIMITRK